MSIYGRCARPESEVCFGRWEPVSIYGTCSTVVQVTKPGQTSVFAFVGVCSDSHSTPLLTSTSLGSFPEGVLA